MLEIVYPTAAMDSSIRRILARFADQSLSYVDAFSLATIELPIRIDGIFAFNHHLGLSGVSVLPGAGQ